MGAAPSANRELSQTEATAVVPLNALLPPFVYRVDMLYHQLVEIHIIVITQLAECTH
jgi:hypothetical protein